MGIDAIFTALAICCARLAEKALLPVNVAGDVLEVLISRRLKGIAAGAAI
jgi:hypothetical protein